MPTIARNTEDADVAIECNEVQLRAIITALKPNFEYENQMGFETTLGTTKHIFRFPQDHFKVELFELSSDAHDQIRFSRRRLEKWNNLDVFIPTAEDVIIQKLRWGRPKDLEDVRGVLAVQAGQLDMTYVRQWCKQHGTLEILQARIESLPAGMWSE